MEQRAHAEAVVTEAEQALAAWRRGDISGEIAIMRLLLALGSAAALDRFLAQSGDGDLQRFARRHSVGIEAAAKLIAAGLAAERRDVAAIRQQFDAAVELAPEAAVALYSLGSPEALDQATHEIVTRLHEWRLLSPTVDVLDIGCGIGRVEGALAPEVRSITGIDLSPAMIAEARRRWAGIANVEFAVCSGTDLSEFGATRFGLMLAVDAFPYLVAADPQIAARHIADAALLLDPGAALAIFNYSYRSNLERDRADVAHLAEVNGFAVERSGTRDFTLWDGATFLLRKLSFRGGP